MPPVTIDSSSDLLPDPSRIRERKQVHATLHKKMFRLSPLAVAMYLLPIFLIFFSLFIGRFEVDPLTVMKILISPLYSFEQTWTNAQETIVLQVRLPRVLAAIMVGAALSMAGASYQGLFKNPLVSPDILGVSAGAGFGGALAILLSGSTFLVQISAFAGGVIAVVTTYLLSRLYKNGTILILVLSGVIVSAFFTALLSITKYIADPYEKLPTIVFWLMGSLSSARYADLFAVAPAMFTGAIILILIRWRINLLSLGSDEARTLGIDLKRTTQIIVICATLLTASAVYLSGIIGWIGLVVPHLARMITGPDYHRMLPLTAALGASYLLVMDDLSRTLFSTEIPLGILTALIGAPFFAYLLARRKTGWG